MFYEYENIQDDLLLKSEEIIEDILGENATEKQKQELLNTISYIFQKNFKNLLDNLENRNTANSFTSYQRKYTNSHNSTPCINIIIANPLINYPVYLPYQPQVSNPPIINSYPFNNSPTPIQLNNPIQIYQPSPYTAYNQFQHTITTPPTLTTHKKHQSKIKKSHKNHNHHHHHKKPSKPPKSNKSAQFTTLVDTFTFSNPSTFSGVVNYLKSHGGIENMIGISTSSQESTSMCLPKDAISHESGNVYFKSRDEPNSWICLDFKEFRVSPTQYTIGTTNNVYKMKSWVIEGSNDNSEWNILDSKNDCPLTKTNDTVLFFPTSNKESEKFRYIRFRLTGLNWSNNFHIRLNSFEIYGKLYK